MTKKNSILRSIGLLTLCLVWLTTVFGKQLPHGQHSRQVSKTKTKQQNKQQPVVSELSLAVVAPSHAFNFTQDFVVIPPPNFFFLSTETVLIKVEKISIIISYFENIFEHHIAINAP